MNNVLEYKGYYGTMEFSLEDKVLYGKVVGIKGLISYEGETLQSLQNDFEGAVDDYLAMCKEKGIEPQKPYEEGFDIRIKPELHKELAVYSAYHGKTLNSVVEEAIQSYVQ